MSGDERPSGAEGLIPRALAEGRIELLGLLPNASNAAFLARCGSGADARFAVYKPQRGETPLWDFPEGTLCIGARWPRSSSRRRSAGRTFRPTVLRDGPEGPGSLQLFIALPDRPSTTSRSRTNGPTTSDGSRCSTWS